VFLSRPENQSGNPGERVTLRCNVDSNPPPAYTWHHTSSIDSQRRLVGNAANLTLLVNPKTTGEYECVAAVDGHNDVTAKALVHVKGPPLVVHSGKVLGHAAAAGAKSSNPAQLAREGETGFVVCEAFSVPEAELIEWAFKGETLELAGQGGRHSVVKKLTGDGRVRSTLVIREVRKEDFGAYGCTVANAFGSDAALIMLRKQSEFNVGSFECILLQRFI
jgi:hypothetical protein